MKNPILMSAVAAALTMAGGVAAAGPQSLSLGELDAITAGSASQHNASGGAIVGNGSSASLSLTGTVDLDSDAQSGANALNLVNSSESTVANGVNVWDGRIGGNGQFANGTDFNVEQSNNVAQEQRRVAVVPEYHRPEANIDETFSSSGSSTGTSTSSRVNQVTDLHRDSSSLDTSTDASVDALSTIAGQEIKAGRGIAGSGELDVWFDGGGLAISADIAVTDAVTGAVTFDLELPEFTVSAEGSVCAVNMGSCNASGTTERLQELETDNSTLSSRERSETFSEEYSEEGTMAYRSPFTLTGAQAEYVVIDESQIDVSSVYTVRLTGAAQQNMRGLNVVNAAGSAVANGVNIARTGADTVSAGNGSMLNMAQTNVIVHSR